MKKNYPTQTKNQSSKPAEVPKPFIQHLYELRKRLVYCVASILIFSTLAYTVQQSIVRFLLKPSHGQQFIYTSPIGGINFLFSVCIYVGIAASTPIIIYQLLAFLEPLLQKQTRHIILRYSFFSALLAAVGFGFGYFLGLPAALHFLTHQFTNNQVHALLTIQEYLSFLTVYLLGAMLMFQLPIILLFINRIRPLGPAGLLKKERYVILLAFIVSMIMVPTPNVLSQLIIAGPIILLYNVSIVLIALHNRRLRQPEIAIGAVPVQPVQAKMLEIPTIDFRKLKVERLPKPVTPERLIIDIRPPTRHQPAT